MTLAAWELTAIDRRVLRALDAAEWRPASAAGCSVQTILRRLEGRHLVERSPNPAFVAEGRGEPFHVWRLTADGAQIRDAEAPT